jgi:hypothetical protein
MTTLTWVGGGNNKASVPGHWSPHAKPQPGDTLQMGGYTVPYPTYTMDIRGNDLAGDPLLIQNANAIINMRHADATLSVSTTAPFASSVTVEMSRNSTLNLTTQGSLTRPTVNLSGSDTLNAQIGYQSGLSVQVADNSTWTGTASVQSLANGLNVSGGTNSTFVHNGSTGFDRSTGIIDIPVMGTGTFGVSGGFAKLEFGSSVGVNQSVWSAEALGRPADVVVIDHPDEFHASTTLYYGGEFDLMGLATADSYSYANDMLNIWSGNKIIDTLRLSDQSVVAGFDVIKTSGSVNVVGLTSIGETLPGALPVHVGA